MAKQWLIQKEIRIPVPYGSIAAKAWGNESAEPVLALHGWQDNAGTFDRLIPLLSSDLHIVAVDAAGHGLSSHKPQGAFYHAIEMVEDIKRIVDFLKWEKFSIMGHSMGGGMALLYSSIFPESVKNVILFDIVKPISMQSDKLPIIARSGVTNSLNGDVKLLSPPPVYSFEEAKERLIVGLHNEITPDSADILLKRGSRPSDCGKGVVFCRDIRLSHTLFMFSHEDMKVFARQIKCNLLIFRGTSFTFYRSPNTQLNDDFLDLYKQQCKSFQVKEVEGNHYFHLNNPEVIATDIDNFFATHCD